MLNSPDFLITAISFPYESEDFAVRVKFKSRKTGKLSEGLYTGKERYMTVQSQCSAQMKNHEYVTATHEPKPKRAVVVAAATPVKGKGKGKK